MSTETNMDEGFIRIAGVTKRFGAVTAVDAADIAIRRGEFFSLLGPSGCGKTTLLRMLAGFEFPDEGTIAIDGQDMAEVPAHRRPTNMVFQSYAIFPHLNVFDNIAFGLRKARLPREEMKARVEDALAMVRLGGLGARKADELSGGQRQRVALARALVRRPKVLLLDEPLGALDKRLREAMQIELRQLQKSVGITFVFVTHDQEEALSMSDRIAVMGSGKVLQIAEPRTLYETPNCREVADFIGTMNFFESEVVVADERAITLNAGALGTVSVDAGAAPDFALATGAKVLIALRPEKITLRSEAPPSGIAVKGWIGTCTYLGERSHFQVHVDGHAAPIAVAGRDGVHANEGETVYLSWADEAPLLLPR